MILSDITIKWKFDYEMEPEEQTFHENFVDTVKFKIARHLSNCGVNSNYRICFEVYYFPQIRKFYVYEISRNSNVIFGNLKAAYSLKDFLIWEYPKSEDF